MSLKVSIIIPAYNSELVLKNTINNVINQTYQNIEIIVVNDGSTDNTEKIVLECKKNDSRIKYIHKLNGGVSSARNIGIQNSNGEFICFLDSDDYFDETYVEKMLDKCIKGKADVCYCGYNMFENGNIKETESKFTDKKILEYYFKGKIYVQTACWFINKEIIKLNAIRFDENLSWGEDIDFFTRVVINSTKTVYVPENLVFYNVEQNNNKLSNYNIKKIDIEKANIEKLLKYKLSVKERKVLEQYRLPALIVYRLIDGIDRKENKSELKKYFYEYKNDIFRVSLIDGLRSVKLIIAILKLTIYMRKI